MRDAGTLNEYSLSSPVEKVIATTYSPVGKSLVETESNLSSY